MYYSRQGAFLHQHRKSSNKHKAQNNLPFANATEFVWQLKQMQLN